MSVTGFALSSNGVDVARLFAFVLVVRLAQIVVVNAVVGTLYPEACYLWCPANVVRAVVAEEMVVDVTSRNACPDGVKGR